MEIATSPFVYRGVPVFMLEKLGNLQPRREVIRDARAAGKRMSILRACRKAWQNVKGGYPSVKAL